MHVRRPMLLLLAACSSEPIPLATTLDACMTRRDRSVGEEPLVYDLGWSPVDDTLLVTGSTALLRAYQADDDGLTLLSTDRSSSRFNSVVFAPDGRTLYAPTGTVLRWYELSDGPVELVPSGNVALIDDGELQRAHVAHEGTRMLLCDTAGDLHLVALDGPKPERLDTLHLHDRCTRIHTAPDAPLVLSAGHDGHVILTSFADDQLAFLDALPMAGEVGEVRFGRRAEVAWAGGFQSPYALWEIAVDPVEGTLHKQAAHSGHRSGIGAIDLDTAGTTLITGDHDHTIHAYDVGVDGGLTPRSEAPFDGHGVHSARTSASGRWLARTAANIDEVTLYDWTGCEE